MQSLMLLDKLVQVYAVDPDDSRRRTLLNILLVGTGLITGFVLSFLAVYWRLGLEPEWKDFRSPLLGALGLLFVILVCYFLNRYWKGWVASVLFLIAIMVISGLIDTPKEVVNGRTLAVFVVPILMASVLLRPWASFAMALIVSLFLSVVATVSHESMNLFAVGIYFTVALVSWLAARSVDQALATVRQANRELDRRVEDQTRDLAEALGREHAESSKNQAVLAGIADGVIVFDNQGRAIVANPAIGRLLDRPSQTLVGQDIQTIMGHDVDPDDRDVVVQLLEQRQLYHDSVKVQWGARTLSVSLAPVRDSVGRMTGTVAVLRDFTREAEVDRMKSDFVSIVSHELRTPLTSINGYLDLVLMGASGLINMQQRSFLTIARDNAERLNELVTDLLDISRIESGKIELSVEVVSVVKVIEQVASSLHKEYSDRGLGLKVDLQPDLPEIFGDRGRVTQIILNLLSNAYKYTSHGGATVQAKVVGNAIQVDVIDTGIGISLQDQEKLFTRFFRAEDAMVRQQPGTGLGLHITKSLVEMHGGRIWLASQPGAGSTFSFTLPLPAGSVWGLDEAERQVQVVVPGASPGSTPTGLHVLMGYDEPDVAHLVQSQLEREGYRVTAVTEAAQVVEAACQLNPDVIILDLVRDVDGLTVLSQLKAEPLSRNIPVVVVSGVPDAEQSLALGAADYLVKPFEEAELLARVQQVLARRYP